MSEKNLLNHTPDHSQGGPSPSNQALPKIKPFMHGFCRRRPGTAHVCFWPGRGGGGWGHAPLVNFDILEVATQIVLETIIEMPSVLNRE